MYKPLTGCLLALMLLTPLPALAAASDAYRAGVEAFQAGDYEQAKESFEQAEAAGMDSAKLHYNLGSTYYKLGQYAQSRQRFNMLVDHPKWGPWAQYNLGLLAERSGDQQGAARYYSQAYESAQTRKLRQLSATKLNRLDPDRDVGVKTREWSGLLSAGAGYDSNATLAPDTTTNDISEEGDGFAELFGVGNYYLKGDYSDGYRLDVGAFTRQFFDESDFSFSTLFAGISRDKQWDTWHTQAALRVSTSLLSDDYYATMGTMRLIGSRDFNVFRLRLRNDLSLIEGDSDFDYVSGVRNRSGIELIRPITDGRIRAGYEFEYNDRDDLRFNDGQFFSYSPYRNEFFAEVDYYLSPKWTINLRGEYQKSLYDDDNRVFRSDGSLIVDERDDDRFIIALRGEYEFAPQLAAFGEVEYLDNSSNFDRYDYESSQIMFGLQKTF